MLGEQDLNPFGFHATEPGRRMPSMMSPTVVLRDGRARARARQRRLEPDPLGDHADDPRAARRRARPWTRRSTAPRVHFEAGDGPRRARDRPGRARAPRGRRGYEVVRWREPNLFFGGVHAVARDPATVGRRRRGPPARRRGRASALGVVSEVGPMPALAWPLRWRARRARGAASVRRGACAARPRAVRSRSASSSASSSCASSAAGISIWAAIA